MDLSGTLTNILRCAVVAGALFWAVACMPRQAQANEPLPDNVPLFLSSKLSLIKWVEPETYNADEFAEWTISFWSQFDQDGDGVSPEEIEYLVVGKQFDKIRRWYEMLDVNRDGIIDATERKAAGPMVADIRHLADADRNHDQIVDASEIAWSIDYLSDRKYGQFQVSEYRQVFVLDPNRDNRVTSTEIAAMARALFDFADEDNNGGFSRAEGHRLHVANMLTRQRHCTPIRCTWE
jgi:hypothetical protein